MNNASKPHHLILGNGFDIQFGGIDYTNKSIIERAISNTKSAILEDHGYSSDCCYFIPMLWEFSHRIAKGEVDELLNLSICNINKRLARFKLHYINSRRNEIGKIGIEDYLFIFELACIHFKINDPERYQCNELLRNCLIDAIYNNGEIQLIYKKYPSKLKEFMSQFDNVFTTNYGQNLEIYLGREIGYLHGAFHILDERYKGDNFLGHLHGQDKDLIIPKYSHIKSTALLGSDGTGKEFMIEAYKRTNSSMTKFANAWKDNVEVHNDIEKWDKGIPLLLKKAINYVAEHPNSLLQINNAFDDFRSLEGTLSIIGLSPFNDNHIFDAINDNSLIFQVIFYYYEKEEITRMGKTLNKKNIKYKSVKELWRNM